jgi:hypothetical protein
MQTVTVSAPVEVSPALVATLKAMRPFLSDDPTRAVLACFGVQGGYLCATDGHRAVRVSLDALGWGALKEGCYKPSFSGSGKKAVAFLQPVDEQFPNLGQVYPKADTKPAWSFSQSLGGRQAGQAVGSFCFKAATVAGASLDASYLFDMPEEDYTVSGHELPATQSETDKARGYLRPVRLVGGLFDIILMPCRR